MMAKRKGADLVDLAEAARERASVLRFERIDKRLARFKRLEWHTLVQLDGAHLSQGARNLSWWIQEHFNDRVGAAWPGVDRLGLLLNVSARRVIIYVGELERRGWVVVKRRKGTSGRGNKYLLALPQGITMRDAASAIAAHLGAVEDDDDDPPRGVGNDTCEVSEMTPREVSKVTPKPSYLNHEKEPCPDRPVDNHAGAGHGTAAQQEAIQDGTQPKTSEVIEASGVQIVPLEFEPVK